METPKAVACSVLLFGWPINCTQSHTHAQTV
uniref:Uncharacterized protein n=1 Tax=Rhizophora mucronata TaxID=61149 RepID=A0A2P2KU52_RHIMU